MKARLFAIAVLAFTFCAPAAAETTFKPFVLASVSDAGLDAQVDRTIAELQDAGFRIAGSYRPLENAVVIVATSDALLDVAAATPRGGYAAGQRISVTERDGRTEVAYVNPLYIQHAYRLGGDMQAVADRLASALGNQEAFGSEKGLSARKLAKYNYMMGMQKFDDPSELGRFASFEAAIAAVEKGLAVEGDALTRVYRIDLPGKEQAVIGVGMKATGDNEDEQDIDETFQMSVVDFEGYSKVAYFPYEILVNGPEVEALHMRFRMAVHFPDLSMMGAHGFTKLMSSPGATEDALENLLIATPGSAAVPTWIDVRSPEEFAAGHVEGAVNIPHTEIAERIGEVTSDKDAVLYLYCRSGRRSGIAKEALEQAGFTGAVNIGGFGDAREKAAAMKRG